jgi:hypothetical protein
VEEIWFVVNGSGRMWRRHHGQDGIVDLRPETWPADDASEATLEQGTWAPTVPR